MNSLLHRVCGMDEVGRGALAGPVVACACVLEAKTVKQHGKFRIVGEGVIIADSKMLSPEAREEAALWLRSNTFYGLGFVSEKVIDEKGILWATQEAMRQALKQLQSKMEIHSVLVDGRDKFSFSVPHTSIIKGDSLEPCIAAASIIAKVARDALMTKAGVVFPEYGFGEHKGYGAFSHREAILTHGPCIMHRKTFLRNILEEQLLLV